MIDLSLDKSDGPEVKLAKATLTAMRIQGVPPEVQAEAAAIMLAALTAEACLGKAPLERWKGLEATEKVFRDWFDRMYTAVGH